MLAELAELAEAERARKRAEARHHSDSRAASAANRIEYTFIVSHMPLLWARHQNGRIAAWLDGRATFTPGQLRAWLRRTVAHLEPDNQRERTQASWADRSARITHDDDGTAELSSVLSSKDGNANDDLINQLARARAQNTDGVTTQQARADIIADLLLGRTSLEGEDTGATRMQARIAVTVPITTLAGLSEQPAISIDCQTASFGRLRRPHASADADARNRSAPRGSFAAPTRSGR